MGIPALSVIISTKNRFDEFRNCLDSVLVHTTVPYELIIIDAGSNDETRKYLSDFNDYRPISISVLMFNSNVPGYAAGNNLAMRMARGKYIFLLNNDNEVTPNWEVPLIEALDFNPHIGWVGPVVLWGDDRIQSAGALVTKDGASISIGSGTPYVKPAVPSNDAFIRCHYLGFGMYRKDLLEKLGYLSEEYKMIYFDDTDYGLMINNAGYDVFCCQNSAIYHKMSDKERARWLEMDPYSLNQPIFLAKWKEWLQKNGV